MDWHPQDKQLLFLRSQADEALYGGAAGGGKSDAILAFSIARRMKYPGTVGLILRRTLPELEKGGGLIPRSKELLAGTANWQERKHRWEFTNGSFQEFGYCDREDDVYRYQGAEYADICFDEATHFTKFQYEYLRSRCRVAGEQCPALIRLATNPGGIGHQWIRKLFVIGHEQGSEWDTELDNGQKIRRSFIPALLKDNKYLGKDYERSLYLLPEKIRDALLHGRWDAYEGQFFHNWDDGVRNIMRREVQAHWNLFCGLDYGYTAPMCALWGAVDEVGRVHIYRELYQAGLRDEEQARIIMTMSKGENGIIYKAGHDVFNKKGATGQSTFETWSKMGLYVTRANNDRVQGWARMRSFMETTVDGIPCLTVDPSCGNLIRTIPEMVHCKGEKNIEDIDEHCEDHACESARYMLSDLRPDIIKKKVEKTFDFDKYIGLQCKKPKEMGDTIRSMNPLH